MLWDLPTRLFHWLLVIAVVASWISVELEEMTLHQWAGYAVMTLVIFRLGWGIWGSRSARFSTFIRSPVTVIKYLKGAPISYLGHNPAGGLSVMALLGLLITQVSTGLFSHDEVLFEAPFFPLVSEETANFLGEIHEISFNLLLLMVGLHLGAIAWHKKFKHTNLIIPMLTGGKAKDNPLVSVWIAIIWFAIAIGLVVGLLSLAPVVEYY